MCGRFSLYTPPETIQTTLAVDRWDAPYLARYNIAPQQDIIAVIQEETRTAKPMSWGLKRNWMSDKDQGFINARCETLQKKKTFHKPYEEGRCLIPADGFYEWMKPRQEKQPYYFHLPDKSVFAFAGLYNRYKGKDTAAIITTRPNREVAKVHDRMPVILEKEDISRWLDEGSDVKALDELLIPFQGELICRPVSKKVNNAANEGPHLLDEAKVETQQKIGDYQNM